MTIKELTISTLEKIIAGEEAGTFEKLKSLFRPEGINDGLVEADPEKCIGCGLCIENCVFKCLEMGGNDVPIKRSDHICFSCFNCIVACPEGALSIIETFNIKGSFFDTGFPHFKLPLEPKDAEGKPTEWTEVERLIMNRRSVRNFSEKPVPEPFIRRVLEAGRFAPSAGNHQPWKFVVVTDKELISQLNEACSAVVTGLHEACKNDEEVMKLLKTTPIGVFDPRVQQGITCVARKELRPYLNNAPVVIFIGGNKKMSNPEMHAGICGMNMNLVANALGLGVCWSNFGAFVNFIPEILLKLGFDDQWTVQTTLCIGYPKFKQEGIVPRHFRSVTWFRQDSDEPQIEE